MKSKYIYSWMVLLFLLCFLTSCAPSPDNAQILEAIRISLSEEASPPELEFESVQVPMRSSRKANAVLWTADGEIQRNYSLEYDRKIRGFRVTAFTTSRRSAEGTYHPIPNDLNLVETKLSHAFDFSEDFNQKYLILYAGESNALSGIGSEIEEGNALSGIGSEIEEGNALMDLRREFERKKLPNMSAEELASFEVCDLGGQYLILIVPRYEGLNIWINELEHRGDMVISGSQVARFEGGLPVYIYCDFSDKLPEYEIHISFDSLGEFFTTRESLLNSIK